MPRGNLTPASNHGQGLPHPASFPDEAGKFDVSEERWDELQYTDQKLRPVILLVRPSARSTSSCCR